MIDYFFTLSATHTLSGTNDLQYKSCRIDDATKVLSMLSETSLNKMFNIVCFCLVATFPI